MLNNHGTLVARWPRARRPSPFARSHFERGQSQAPEAVIGRYDWGGRHI
jgi:hypothetical protein